MTMTAAVAAELADINAALQQLGPQSGRFEQTAANGALVEGRFHMDWPDRLRFAYEPDGAVVTVKGKFVAIQDTPRAEPNWIPVSVTPLAVMRNAVRHGISADMVTQLDAGEAFVAVSLEDPDGDLPGSVTLYFTTQGLQLYAWRLVDAQNLVTQVRLTRIRRGGVTDADFAIAYDAPDEEQ